MKLQLQRACQPSRQDHQKASQAFTGSKVPNSVQAHPFLQLHQMLGNRAVGRLIQAKFTINQLGDVYEQEADRVAKQVMQMPAPLPAMPSKNLPPTLQRKCAACAGGDDLCSHCAEEEKMVQRKPLAVQTTPVVQRQMTSDGNPSVSPSVENHINNLRNGGQPLPESVRAFFEPRFGYDFSRVKIHADAQAAESAQAMNALAYTVGQNVVFSAGQYEPGTSVGRRLLAHELTHVAQQSGAEGIRVAQENKKYALSPTLPLSAAENNIVQRTPQNKTEAYYQKLVKQGKWCRDSEKTGKLHPGQQCYREIPPSQDYPPGDQVCFSKVTGQFIDPPSPDFCSAVSGQKKDGTCDIPTEFTDPPHPFSQRGRRALCHAVADVATEDPDLIGKYFGGISGVMMGIALPRLGFDSIPLTLVTSELLGVIGFELGRHGLPLLYSFAKKHGFVPTISLGFGSNFGLGLGVGFEKRDRPLPFVPINSYLTFGFDSSLSFTDEPDANSTFIARVGVRIDPGKQGGLFTFGSVGAGIAATSEVSGATSKELGVGFRATDFLDVKLGRETVSSGSGSDDTYWLTLQLVAPQRVLKGHRR